MNSGKTIEKPNDKSSEVDTIEIIHKDLLEQLDALEEREKYNEDERNKIQQSKKELIDHTALRMEAFKKSHGLPTDTISAEISEMLKPRNISERYVRKCLPKRFKNKTKSENARSNMNNPSVEGSGGNSAEHVPQTRVATNKEVTEIPDASNRISYQDKQKKENSPSKDISVLDIDKIAIRSPIGLPKEQWSETSKCLECPKKDGKIRELEGKILRQDKTIDNLPKNQTACDTIEEGFNPFTISFDILFEDLRKDMAGNNRLVKESNIIRFKVMFDPVTRIVSHISWEIIP